MTAFALQTMLLLGLAYLLGCWLACLLRRMTSSAQDRPVAAAATASAAVGAAAVARQSAPFPKIEPVATQTPASAPSIPAAAGAPVRDAFRRADTLEPAPAPQEQPKPAAAPAQTVPQPARTPAVMPSPATAEETVNRFERARVEAPAARGAAPGTPGPARPAAPSVSAAHAAIAGAAAAAAAASAAATRSAPAGAPAPVRVQAPTAPLPASPETAADDLKRIRTIDEGLEAALHRLGIRRYADMAAWKPEDVARISKEFGFKGRIEQENWIEQAQILARGEDTFYSSRLARGEQANARPIADEGEPARPVAAHPVPAPAAPARTEAALAAPVPAPAAVAPPAPIAPAPPAPSAQRTSIEAAAKAATALAAAASAAAAHVPAAPATQPPAATSSPAAAPAAAAVSPSAVRPAAVSDHAAFAGGSTAASSPAPAQPSAPRAIGSARDHLQRIGGITPEIERLLNVQGVSRYSQIAHWGKTDVERFDGLLGHQGRIQRENWIEQAQILARGGDTSYSREHDRREAQAASHDARPAPAPAAAVPTAPMARVTAPSIRTPEPTPAVAPPPPAAVALPQATSAPAAQPSSTAAAAALAAAAAAAAAAASGAMRPVSPPPDDTSASQAARPSRLADAIRGNDTRPSESRGVLQRPSSDLSSLRSVRSEGLRGGAPTAGVGGMRGAELHDLKRIRGIGVLIEKKLNSMGVSRYEHIAEWTTEDIERVSQVLDFKGRIERENWVEQARILASGGQTEFSRRADRGETGGPS